MSPASGDNKSDDHKKKKRPEPLRIGRWKVRIVENGKTGEELIEERRKGRLPKPEP